ncbi:MAG: glycoside hydrolase family 3 C-terminal domain-containing protein [Lachnospiraceae bacterium]|nr:glycoside hydrolase family 3 C-terminal domain-containing protein [Lachnospiraceae bacterium]
MRKYEKKEDRLKLARELAAEAIVLLKNDNRCLPLSAGEELAVFGQAQLDTAIGGGGSGASHCDNPLQIAQELEKAGFVLAEGPKTFYEHHAQEKAAAAKESGFDMSSFEGLVASGAIYEIFGRYIGPAEEPVPAGAALESGAKTALLVLTRASGGEECDRRVEQDYYLTDSENELVKAVCGAYEKVVLILNVNGAVDTAWIRNYPQIQALLFMGTPGEAGAGALADILSGKVSPSGRLSQTLALAYDDYPTARNMSWNKDDPSNIRTYADYGLDAAANGSTGWDVSPVTVYEEDIYLGYRYFDSFEKDVMFPFGFGLSYADFEVRAGEMTIKDGVAALTVTVKNTSETYGGKEVVQLYLSAQADGPERPARELKDFAKTACLAPGEEQTLTLCMPLTELAVFDEEQGCYVIPRGLYTLQIGTSSRNTSPAGQLAAEREICVRKAVGDIGFSEANKGKIRLLHKDTEKAPEKMPAAVRIITKADLPALSEGEQVYDFSQAAEGAVLRDVAEGRVSMEAFVAQMSVRELAVLCNGYGPGLPFGGLGRKEIPSTIQDENGEDIGYNSHPSAFPGYENPAVKKYGIYSACYKDGPASVGDTAWPTGMMLACMFNKELLYAFGDACGYESEIQDVDAWLAPGMNLIRNPIGGRDFEYFSEDPILAGICGVEIAKGAMENNDVSVCPKHFAVNEQETYRRGKTSRNIDAADSIISARAARELYLKPFEMVITQARPRVLMTSFNKINGTFAGGNRALCTDILRGEWGYTGVVVTDWGDMDAVVDGADAVEAGNDVVMPGGPPVIEQVLKGYEEGRVSKDAMRKGVLHLMNFVMNSRSYKRGEQDGKSVLSGD